MATYQKVCRASTGKYKKCASKKRKPRAKKCSTSRAKHPRDPKTGRFVRKCKK